MLDGSSSGGLIDVEGLVSQALSKLQTTFFTEAQEKLDSQVSIPSLHLSEIEGPTSGGKMTSEMAIALGLIFITCMRINLPAIGKEAHEVTCTTS